MTNVSKRFYLQGGGKKSTGIDMEQNYFTVTVCIYRKMNKCSHSNRLIYTFSQRQCRNKQGVAADMDKKERNIVYCRLVFSMRLTKTTICRSLFPWSCEKLKATLTITYAKLCSFCVPLATWSRPLQFDFPFENLGSAANSQPISFVSYLDVHLHEDALQSYYSSMIS